MELALVILLLTALFLTFWFLMCNHRTYSQRIKIINWVYDGSGNWRQRDREYNRVSYDQHLWALFTFRNPQKLYKFSETD
jgi:hypothetical protein